MANEIFSDDILCSICLENLEAENISIIETTCNHIFHDQCLNIWLDNHNTCPCCRTIINDLPNIIAINNPENNIQIENFIDDINSILLLYNNYINNINLINNYSINEITNNINNENIINNMIDQNVNNFLINEITNNINNENIIDYMINQNMNNLLINNIFNNINNINDIENNFPEEIQQN
jgi:hypothetical protein